MLTKILTKIFVTTLAALFASYLLSGVQIDGLETAVIVAIVLALLNTFIKPILIFFTLPITILTLGLFLLVINILIIKWAADLVSGFHVDGWWPALLFSLIVSFVSSILEGLLGDNKKKESN